ncbi:Ag5r family protein [Megaselia abdita]
MFRAVLTLSLLTVTLTSAANYCNKGLCPAGKAHIGCNNSGNLASSCPSGSKFLSLEKLKGQIVKAHNEKRNEVAGGRIPNHSPAVRMATIQWDDELSYLAGLNVKTCKYGHDQCRNTNTYKLSGQNLAKNWWYGFNQNISVLIGEQIQAWFDEYKVSDMSKINKVASSSGGPVTGHFTAMVHELAIRVGCAAMRSSEIRSDGRRWETLTTACNYAHTNVIGYKIYRSGAAASQCKSGKNKIFPNLCSVREVYNYNSPLN